MYLLRKCILHDTEDFKQLSELQAVAVSEEKVLGALTSMHLFLLILLIRALIKNILFKCLLVYTLILLDTEIDAR